MSLNSFDKCLKYIKKCKRTGETVQWNIVSFAYALTLDFIIEYQDELDWYYLSSDQKLDENTVRLFQDRIKWDRLDPNRYSKEFLREFRDRFKFKQWCLKDEFKDEFGDPEVYDQFFYQIKARRWLKEVAEWGKKENDSI